MIVSLAYAPVLGVLLWIVIGFVAKGSDLPEWFETSGRIDFLPPLLAMAIAAVVAHRLQRGWLARFGLILAAALIALTLLLALHVLYVQTGCFGQPDVAAHCAD